MIIESVQAERLHKYRNLRLVDLPERGIIAISGDNETGKSAIGEIICFALFGRTHALGNDRIGKLVHWGAGDGAVTLRFRMKGGRYEIMRGLACDGEQSARLVSCEQPGEPLARGAAAVNARIEGLLGYGFDAYIETMYLAQREITTPHPHSPAIKMMVGIAPLERCAADLREEAASAEQTVGQMESRLGSVDEALAELGSHHTRVAALEEELAQTRDQEGEIAARLAALGSAADAYCDACRGSRSHFLRRRLAGLLSKLVLFMTVILAVVWAGLRFQSEFWFAPDLRVHLEAWAGKLGLLLDAAFVYAGILVVGTLLLVWLWSLLLALGARRRRLRARRLSQEFDQLDAFDFSPASLRTFDEGILAEEDAPSVGRTLIDSPDAERRSRLQQRILSLEASVDEVQAAFGHESAWLNRFLEQLSARVKETEASLARARNEREHHVRLTQERQELEAQLAVQRERIETRRLACELLGGAAARMSEHFSECLRGMVSKALPQFTEGRYDHLQLDEALQVRVYSSDKRNLLDLDEISSGTQRQIMLALRLGLAQELVSRVVRDDQFTFLDEPFAFFDSGRMRAALQSLAQLGGDLVQHWVVAQRFPKDAYIGLEIACGGHPDTLEVGRPETD